MWVESLLVPSPYPDALKKGEVLNKDVKELMNYIKELETNNKELVEILNNSLRKTARVEKALHEQAANLGHASDKGMSLVTQKLHW